LYPLEVFKAASQQSTARGIHLKPYKVLVVSGDQLRDDHVIHNAADFGDIVALLKLWGVPFDFLRLDTHTMVISDFVDGTGQPKYGAIIWTADQRKIPAQEYSILAQAVITYDISLIAVGEKMQEPVIQDLLGLTCKDKDNDCWEPITEAVTPAPDHLDHFISRELSGTIPPEEAFPLGLGPAVTITATDVVSTLAYAGPWPQLTARTIDEESRTRAVWIGGDPYRVFQSSPTFIKILRRSLVWAIGYGVYKDYGHSVVLRIDDPGGAPSAYWKDWHYAQLTQTAINDFIIAPLQTHSATLGVAFNPGYPWIPTRSITRSCGVDFIDPFGTRQNIISTCAGLRDGIEAKVLEVHCHGLTHMVPDLDTPIPGSTNWWDGSIGGEWDHWGWYREFYDTRRNTEVDAQTQRSRLITCANWIEEDFGQRPLIFIPGGHAISGDHYEEFTVTIAITGAMPLTTYMAYYGKEPNFTDLNCTIHTDTDGAGQCVFTSPWSIFDLSDANYMYFTINRVNTGTQFIGGPVVEPLSYTLDFDLRDYTQMTEEERITFHLAVDTFAGGSVVGTGSHIADNYTYRLAAEAGYSLALDETAHYLDEDNVVTLDVCVDNLLGQDDIAPECYVDDLQGNFDRGVPAVAWFHDYDFYRYRTDFLSNCLVTITERWSDVYYMSMDEWTGYMHTRLEARAPTTDSVQIDFAFDDHYCRYFGVHTSTWTLHLSDELREDFNQVMGKVVKVVDGTTKENFDAATTFTEIQVLTVPAGIRTHTILFGTLRVYLPFIMKD
jgi:hypothetical protein